jgi:RNA polymerase sigma factor (sigma-70 family)
MTASEFARHLLELRPRALRIAFCVTKNHWDTEDAVQDADVKWWKAVVSSDRLEVFSETMESDAFYFRLVRCSAIDTVRKRWRRDKIGTAEADLISTDEEGMERSPLDHAKATGSLPDQVAEATERRRGLNRCLEKLEAAVPPADFKLWWQCDGQGRLVPDIAAEAGVKYEATKSRIRRVREKLRKIVNAESELQSGQ